MAHAPFRDPSGRNKTAGPDRTAEIEPSRTQSPQSIPIASPPPFLGDHDASFQRETLSVSFHATRFTKKKSRSRIQSRSSALKRDWCDPPRMHGFIKSDLLPCLDIWSMLQLNVQLNALKSQIYRPAVRNNGKAVSNYSQNGQSGLVAFANECGQWSSVKSLFHSHFFFCHSYITQNRPSSKDHTSEFAVDGFIFCTSLKG